MMLMPRATRMTREGRDTLWLLLALAMSLTPHLGRLPLWCSIGTVLALLDDPDRAAALGHAGRRRSAEFTWQRCARATAAMYGELLT